jgi:hypothetical protein
MRWFVGFILVELLLSGATDAQTRFRSIPFTVSSDTGLLMIPVSVGGDQTTPFVLDTRSGVSVLSQSLVDKLGGKATGRFTGFRLTGERMDLRLFTIPELRVGPVLQRNALVAGWDGMDKFHLAGMISLNFFAIILLPWIFGVISLWLRRPPGSPCGKSTAASFECR